MASSGVRRLKMSKKAAKGTYKSPTTVKSTVGREDPKTGYMAGKKRMKTRGTGAATKGTKHTSYT
jgi:hypothetical protein